MSDYVSLAHGAGGKKTSELIDKVFKENFNNSYFTSDDAAVLPHINGRIAISTDGFIVSPSFYPGGNIGKLSICGTVNDLSCMGAKPLYMTNSFIIEEGYPMDKLREIARSMKETAEEVGVKLVAGDTKVAGKSQVDGVFITTTGVGEIIEGVNTGGALAEDGDLVIVTGDIGRHGAAILLSRDQYGIEADIESDCAPLWNGVNALLKEIPEVHVIRDATRGGVGTVLYEIAKESDVAIHLDSEEIPVDESVRGITDMLGLEPLYLACEGRLVIVLPKSHADKAIKILRQQKYMEGSKIIGEIKNDFKSKVIVKTLIGAETILPNPGNELLPRIC